MNKNVFLFLTVALLLSNKIHVMEIRKVRIGNTYNTVFNAPVNIEGDFNGDFNSLAIAGDSQTWKCKKKESKKLDVAGTSFVRVENTDGSITVVGENRSDFELIISKLGATDDELKKVETEISSKDNSLFINTKYLTSSVLASIKYKLLVPANKLLEFYLKSNSGNTLVKHVMGQVTAKTTSGEAKIRAIVGNSKVETTSGDIKISSVQGNTEVESKGGRVKANEITGDLQIKTSSGNIDASDAITGNITINTTIGSIILRKKTINAPITVKTTSGDVKLCANDFNANLDVKTVSGEFNSDFPIAITRLRPKGTEIETQVGLGGPSVKLSSVAGNIKLIKK